MVAIFRLGLPERDRGPLQLVAHVMVDRPRILQFERQDEVGLIDQGAAPARLREIMHVRHIEPAEEVDDRRLDEFGELDEELHALGVVGIVVGEDHGIVGRDQQFRDFAQGAAVGLRRHIAGQFRNDELRFPRPAGSAAPAARHRRR